MATSLACPDLRDLERLAQGQFPEPEAEQLRQHIPGCSSCANLRNALDAHDPLVTDLPAIPGQQLPDNPFVDALIERLVSTHPDSVGAVAPSASVTATRRMICKPPGPFGSKAAPGTDGYQER